MNSSSPPIRSAARTSTEVTCSSCNAVCSVPFTPTPGRPVYCRACFAKKGPATSGGGSRPQGSFARANVDRPEPRKYMLKQGRKAHFVYDALEVLQGGSLVEEEQRRTFVEMVFTRGSRQSTDAAVDFIEEKVNDETIKYEEGERIVRLLERYSMRR